MADKGPLRRIVEAIEGEPLRPVDLGARVRVEVKDWRNALAECEGLGLVTWRKPHWHVTAFGHRWLKGLREGEPIKAQSSEPAPVRQHKDRIEGPTQTVGEEFAALRRRRRAL